MASVLNRYVFSGATGFTDTRTATALALSVGTARKFVVCSIVEHPTKTTSAVTYNGTACAVVGSVLNSGIELSWWSYDIPDALGAANYDVVFTFSNTATGAGHTYAAWVTQGDTPGTPRLVSASQAAGSATIAATIDAVAGDVLLTASASPSAAGTTWSNAASPQVTVGNRSDSSASGTRAGKADAIGDATESVTLTWTLNVSTDPLTMSLLNSTPAIPYYTSATVQLRARRVFVGGLPPVNPRPPFLR